MEKKGLRAVSIKFSEIDFYSARGLQLACPPFSIVILPEIGGRVISYSRAGQEAFFCSPEAIRKRIQPAAVAAVAEAKRSAGWLHYGGYKTWLAPQERWLSWPPYLDLDSGHYTETVQIFSDAIEVGLKSPVCRETGMQFLRRIKLLISGEVEIHQGMKNCTEHSVSWGLWDVTQMCGPGEAILPITLSRGEPMGFRAYADVGDSVSKRATYVRFEEAMAIVSCRQKEIFKYGTESSTGWLAGILPKPEMSLCYLKIFETFPKEPYPHQSIQEIFDAVDLPYFELEVHSPLKNLAPAEEFFFSERWYLESFAVSQDFQDIKSWIQVKRKEYL